jgi:hypothetical protein
MNGADAFEQWQQGIPLILAICETPLLAEALADDLQSIAIVRRFPAGRGGALGLAASVAPDAVVVDRSEEADELETLDMPLVHVLVDRRVVRVHRADGWHELPNPTASAAAIRNVLLGEIFAVVAHRRSIHTSTDAQPGGIQHGGDLEAR